MADENNESSTNKAKSFLGGFGKKKEENQNPQNGGTDPNQQPGQEQPQPDMELQNQIEDLKKQIQDKEEAIQVLQNFIKNNFSEKEQQQNEAIKRVIPSNTNPVPNTTNPSPTPEPQNNGGGKSLKLK